MKHLENLNANGMNYMKQKYNFSITEREQMFKIRRAGTFADVVEAFPAAKLKHIKDQMYKMGLSCTDKVRMA